MPEHGDTFAAGAAPTSPPHAPMRQGNFSVLLNPAINGTGIPIQLHQPGSGGAGGTATLSCEGQNKVFCSSQVGVELQVLFVPGGEILKDGKIMGSALRLAAPHLRAYT